ncbi:type I 3-dehydroquinate dehydratase [Erwinia sorbitola]|uniref:3-dehydroquinate dehydratase n=1 Tax=Erwinia sorbitola TaxID=2681984 RepID=A0ABW9R847_9GAMM|nr:type I 3-dehydroquinate dehydratase [Erwinia sorbitola]MTD26313.1 type I 3-dehydroquinate dehydratase [Erwinia sorbitola]
MTAIVNVKNITFGAGKPLICVPLIGRTLAAIGEDARQLAEIQADVIEWRADHFESVDDVNAVKAALQQIRAILPQVPLLFTFRSKKEGGEHELSDDAYFNLNSEIARSGLVDLIDIELFNEEPRIRALVAQAHSAGVKVIMSNHDFHKTPSKTEIIARLCRMQTLGADLPKIAVMPQSPHDVLVLLDATLTMKEEHATCPLITMSMGKTGVISRLAGEVFGSAMTFGAARQASAPGQIAVQSLREMLNVLSH